MDFRCFLPYYDLSVVVLICFIGNWKIKLIEKFEKIKVILKYKYSDITIKFFVLGIASESLLVFYSFTALLLNS